MIGHKRFSKFFFQRLGTSLKYRRHNTEVLFRYYIVRLWLLSLTYETDRRSAISLKTNGSKIKNPDYRGKTRRLGRGAASHAQRRQSEFARWRRPDGAHVGGSIGPSQTGEGVAGGWRRCQFARCDGSDCSSPCRRRQASASDSRTGGWPGQRQCEG